MSGTNGNGQNPNGFWTRGSGYGSQNLNDAEKRIEIKRQERDQRDLILWGVIPAIAVCLFATAACINSVYSAEIREFIEQGMRNGF